MPARSTTASNAVAGIEEAADHVVEAARTEMKQRADDLSADGPRSRRDPREGTRSLTNAKRKLATLSVIGGL